MLAGEGFERRASLHRRARKMLAADVFGEGRLRQDLAADLDAVDGALEIVAFGEGVGIDDRRIAQIGRSAA